MQFSVNFKSLCLGWNISLLSKRTLVVSTFLSMRNKFACFLAWEYVLQDLTDSWKAFLHPVDCGCRSCKSCWNAWRNSGWPAGGQVNITDEAKLESAVSKMYEMLAVQCTVKLGLELCLSHKLWWLQTLLILTPVISLLNILLIDDNFSRIQKGLANETGEDH